MINPTQIRELLESELEKRELFLVEVVVRPGNKIALFIDSMKGITLDECSLVSKFLESRLDRDNEDFELEVSSPGLDKPLKLPAQFEKNKGRILDVVKTDGIKITGKLQHIEGTTIRMEVEQKVKDRKTGKKRVELAIQEVQLEVIKSAKVVISLKK
jgi:ribosome maturation factor RimP